MDSVDRIADRNLFRVRRLLRYRQRELLHGSIPAVVCGRLLVYRIDVLVAGTVRRTLGRLGDPYQAVPGRSVAGRRVNLCGGYRDAVSAGNLKSTLIVVSC